jgi:hypothetical protein
LKFPVAICQNIWALEKGVEEDEELFFCGWFREKQYLSVLVIAR